MSRQQPFAGLSPDTVLEAAARIGFEPDGRLFALNSYENRVYQLGVEGAAPVVFKFYREGRWSDAQILEEHAFARELGARDLAVAQPLERDGRTLFGLREFRYAAFEYLRARAAVLDAPGALEQMGRTLGRLHAVGAAGRFRARAALSVERLGWQARATVLASPQLDAALATRYAEVSASVLELIEREFGLADDIVAIRIHGDCHAGNILWNDAGPVIVDLDDCMAGPRVQDLWMFLSGDAPEQRRQWAELEEGYLQFSDFDYRELRLVEPLRALRMLHHVAWIAARWSDPAFPRAFPTFAEPRFWERHLVELMEQLAQIEQPPLLQG